MGKFNIIFTDDYRTGPRIYLSPIDDADDDDLDMVQGVVELTLNQTFDVYYISFGIDEPTLKLLKSFPTSELAEHYAKCQYYHYTGDYPFIVSGMTSGYKSEGTREPFDVTGQCDIQCVQDDEIEGLVIAQKDHLECHSLNPFAEW